MTSASEQTRKQPMPLNKRKPVRLLHDIRVEEISAVDVGAAIGAKIMMRKRDSTFGGYPTSSMRKNTDADRDDEEESDTGGESTDQLERAERAMKETKMKSYNQMMRDVIKRYGLIPFCKSVANGDVSVSEHELTKLISESAARAGTTFAKIFESPSPEGVVLRKAIAAARDAQFVSRTTSVSKQQMFHAGGDGYCGDPPAPGRASLQPRLSRGRESVGAPRSALDAVRDLVAAQMRAAPDLSEAQAWDKVYASKDSETRRAVEAERLEIRPVARG
jgi:hypothetical protein